MLSIRLRVLIVSSPRCEFSLTGCVVLLVAVAELKMVVEDVMFPSALSPASKTAPASCSEVRCGGLTLVNACGCKSNDVRVVVKAYRTSLEHFAVVYPDKVVCKPIGFVNLKHCSVVCLMNSPRTLQIVQKSCDGGVLTFRAESPADAKKWLEALQNGPKKLLQSRKTTTTETDVSLPILEEEGDEE